MVVLVVVAVVVGSSSSSSSSIFILFFSICIVIWCAVTISANYCSVGEELSVRRVNEHFR